MRLSRMILFFLLGVFVAQCVYYYPNLPAQMASHFNGAGEPNGWMPKNGYFLFLIGVLLFIFIQLTFLPASIGKLPNSLINLPNKEYWLSEERRSETINVFRHFFEWFNAALIALFIGINQLVIRANLNREILSSQSWLILGAFLIFVVVWLVKFYKRFKVENI